MKGIASLVDDRVRHDHPVGRGGSHDSGGRMYRRSADVVTARDNWTAVETRSNLKTHCPCLINQLEGGDHRHRDPAPGRGVPSVLEPHRQQRPRGFRRPCRVGQPVHAQDPGDPALAGPPSPLHAPFHFPTYSSWLNLVERWFAELTTKWLRRGTHRSVKELVASIRTWIANWNDDPNPFVWHKTADEILDSLAAYCQRIPDSAH